MKPCTKTGIYDSSGVELLFACASFLALVMITHVCHSPSESIDFIMIETNTDRDFFRVDITGNAVQLQARSISEFDTAGRLWDENCDQLAFDDDAFGVQDFELFCCCF